MNTKANRDRYKKSFAKRLRVALAVAGMNGAEVAREAGIQVASIYDYMNGRTLPHAFNLARLCIILDCDANDLLGIRKGK